MRLFWQTHYEYFVTDRTDNIVMLVVRVQGRTCSIVVQSMDCVVGHEKTCVVEWGSVHAVNLRLVTTGSGSCIRWLSVVALGDAPSW